MAKFRQPIDEKALAWTAAWFAALVHFVWILAVQAGVGQQLVGWIFEIHALSLQMTVLPFSIGTAITLLIATFICGFVGGWLFARIWNWVVKTFTSRT